MSDPSTPNENVVVNSNEADDLEGDLKEIYDLVKVKVSQIVATGKLTSDHLRPLLLDLVEVVQEYSSGHYDHIDGAKKKAMSLNVLRHVFKDLRDKEQISQSDYEMIMLSLEFFGGVLIDFGKVVYNKLVEVATDISDRGCSGCTSRNFRPKKR